MLYFANILIAYSRTLSSTIEAKETEYEKVGARILG
jgi:hypothetical protein